MDRPQGETSSVAGGSREVLGDGPPAVSVVPIRPSGGPALGDLVKLQVSAEEARKKLEASGTAKPEPTPTPDLPERVEPGSNRPTKDGGHLDNQGRGEAYWKAKAERLRRAATDAAAARGAAEANVDSWEHAMPSGDFAIQTWARELTRLRGEADRTRRDEQAVRKRLEDLSEEARKANAYPGWLR